MNRRSNPWPVALVLTILLALHFYIRPRLLDSRGAPDFLLLALLLLSIRSRPGTAAIAGFLVGLAADVLTPARFGAGALAHTVVGYLAAWGRALFFPDNLLVNAGFFAGGVWLRTLIVLVVSGASSSDFGSMLLVWGPVQAVTTAVAGIIVVLIFRKWLAIRLDE